MCKAIFVPHFQATKRALCLIWKGFWLLKASQDKFESKELNAYLKPIESAIIFKSEDMVWDGEEVTMCSHEGS